MHTGNVVRSWLLAPAARALAEESDFSRQDNPFVECLPAALRNQFGGHAVTTTS